MFTILEEIKDVSISLSFYSCRFRNSVQLGCEQRSLELPGRVGLCFKRSGGSPTVTLEFARKLYADVKVLDSVPRSSVNTFAGRSVGDVLLAWENAAHLLSKEGNGDKFEFVTPSLSILAEPAASVISDAANQAYGKRWTRAYIYYLYSTNAQDITGKHYYRSRDEKVGAKYSSQFP